MEENKSTRKNPYFESWEKELANKNFEELVKIVALKEQFNAEFVDMARSKLMACGDYNEERVNSMIEEIKKEPQPKLNIPADTILRAGNAGCFSMKVILGIIAIGILFSIVLTNIKDVANIPPVIYDTPILFIFFLGVVYIIIMKMMAVYKPSPVQKSKQHLKIVLGSLFSFGTVCLWIPGQSYPGVLNTMALSCIMFGWAIYCFFVKRSDSGVRGKVLKLFYAILLTYTYFGCYANLTALIIYGIVVSVVPIMYNLNKNYKLKKG